MRAPPALPLVILVALFGLAPGQERLSRQPLLAFFFVSCLMASIVYIGWGLARVGFLELSEVGLI